MSFQRANSHYRLAGDMEFRILGPLEVADGDQLLALGGGKQRALLALLLLSANEVVSTDRLIDELWGERSPDSGRTALQVRLSRLRKALGPAGAQLLTRAPGYVLSLHHEQLDLHRFERLIGQAVATEPALAAEKLREALALWRGPPLADLALRVVRAARDRTDGGATDRGARAADRCGPRAWRRPIWSRSWSRWSRHHPLHERLAGQLMLALYRCGRQADALATYRRTSDRLRDELSLEPSPALRGLERSILEQEPTLDALPAPPAFAAAIISRVPRRPSLVAARELADLTARSKNPACGC